jgi:7-cyano-7-deazaguanine synthase
MNKEAVISVSGGLDSTALLVHMLNKKYDKVHAVSFYYGQKNEIELRRLETNLRYLKSHKFDVTHTTMNLASFMGKFNSSLTSEAVYVPTGKTDENKMKTNFVPNRNAIFSSLIYGYAVSLVKEKDIYVDIGLGVHDGTHTIPPDCTRTFFNKLESAFKEGNVESEKINYYLPYVDGYKDKIVTDACECCSNLGLSIETIFRNTLSCYHPNEDGDSCGECGACNDRMLAFNKVEGIKDSIKYIQE